LVRLKTPKRTNDPVDDDDSRAASTTSKCGSMIAATAGI
jgi:hypothetical protein